MTTGQQKPASPPPEPDSIMERVASYRAGSRVGEPNDIGYAVLYLASDESKFVNGTEIIIDNSVTATEGVVA
jgi:NAD(P)-dependent dehydrogenase (short-subunit alcohol dehydrogenase family)